MEQKLYRKFCLTSCRVVYLTMCWVAAVSSSYASVFGDLFPTSIKLGLSPQQLIAIRPNAAKSPAALLPRTTTSANTFEMIERIPPTTFYTYVFGDNTLQAVIRSEPVIANGPNTMNPRVLSKALAQEFRFLSSEEVARASTTLEHVPVTAELWDDPQTEMHAYFVSTSQETTLIFFDPSKLNSGSFFIKADKIPDLRAGVEAIRSKSGTDGKAPPPLIDRPWETKSALSPGQLSSMQGTDTSQNISTQRTQGELLSPAVPTFPSSIEQPQSRSLFNPSLVITVVAAIFGFLIFLFKRR